jgi:hypothetical protein
VAWELGHYYLDVQDDSARAWHWWQVCASRLLRDHSEAKRPRTDHHDNDSSGAATWSVRPFLLCMCMGVSVFLRACVHVCMSVPTCWSLSLSVCVRQGVWADGRQGGVGSHVDEAVLAACLLSGRVQRGWGQPGLGEGAGASTEAGWHLMGELDVLVVEGAWARVHACLARHAGSDALNALPRAYLQLVYETAAAAEPSPDATLAQMHAAGAAGMRAPLQWGAEPALAASWSSVCATHGRTPAALPLAPLAHKARSVPTPTAAVVVPGPARPAGALEAWARQLAACDEETVAAAWPALQAVVEVAATELATHTMRPSVPLAVAMVLTASLQPQGWMAAPGWLAALDAAALAVVPELTWLGLVRQRG